MNKTNKITKGVYSNFRLVKSRNVIEICIEIPQEQGESFVEMFGMPSNTESKWLAIASLNKPIVEDHQEGVNAIQRSTLVCQEKKFQQFLRYKGVEEVTSDPVTSLEGLKKLLGIKSRTELRDRQTRYAFNNLMNQYEEYCLRY